MLGVVSLVVRVKGEGMCWWWSSWRCVLGVVSLEVCVRGGLPGGMC